MMPPMSTPPPQVWPCVVFDDARAGIRFCTEVLGFTAAAVHANDEGNLWSFGTYAGTGSDAATPTP